MPLLRVVVAFALVLSACGSSQKPDDDEPTTAREKQRRDTKDKGESDGGKWGGWRYQGDRDDCFFVIGRRCFKTEKAACNAAKCAAPQTCQVTGGGPATVACAAPAAS